MSYVCSAPSLHLLQKASSSSRPASPQISQTFTCNQMAKNYHIYMFKISAGMECTTMNYIVAG